ncbi:hypothetical protein M093_3280 [Bacteroides uniformis str. 3978 T3 i]|nr:hypothetical protein M093_3280 [Bacteroides uniformis str. 3978 T3 i]
MLSGIVYHKSCGISEIKRFTKFLDSIICSLKKSIFLIFMNLYTY